jgi:hypothetical protein
MSLQATAADDLWLLAFLLLLTHPTDTASFAHGSFELTCGNLIH